MMNAAGRLLIVAFVLWHGFSVAVYTIPRESRDAVSKLIRSELLPAVTPYMQITSQWQLWNLFSPDPLRRVTTYHVQVQQDGTWNEIRTIEPGTISLWRHATIFKMMSNIAGEFENNRNAAVGRFLHVICEDDTIAKGTPIRLEYEYYIIPYHTRRASIQWWNEWRPRPERSAGFQTTCP